MLRELLRRSQVNHLAASAALVGAALLAVGVARSEPGPPWHRIHVPAPKSPFVTTCKTGFCIRGKRFWIKGATAYNHYDDPVSVVALAKSGNLNTLELVEFQTQHHVLSDAQSLGTWQRVDRFIATVRAHGLHVILNFSEFGQSLQAAGYTMSSPSWQSQWSQFLTFVATRINTVTGVRYMNDPTIAMVEIWAEIPAPGYPNPVGTAQQMIAFYANTFATWKRLAPRILVSSGGFSYLNNGASGVPWREVMSNPNNALCDFEINSKGDRNTTAQLVTQYCKTLGKPWFLGAWSSCNKPDEGGSRDWFGGDVITDEQMAAHTQDMYRIAKGGRPAAYMAVGTDFWNIGREATLTCELGPQFPKTWSVVKTN